MQRVVAVALQLHMLDRGLVADLELGDCIALKAAQTEAAEAFQQRGRAAGLGDHDVAGDDRGRLAVAVELDEMDGLIEGHIGADTQGGAARHQSGVEREHRIVVARSDLSERGFEPGRRLLQSVAERQDLDALGLQSGDIRQIGAQIALDHHQAIGREAPQSRGQARAASSASPTATPSAFSSGLTSVSRARRSVYFQASMRRWGSPSRP